MDNETGADTPVRNALIVHCEADDQWTTWVQENLEDHDCTVRRLLCPADADLGALVAHWLGAADRCVIVVSEAFLAHTSYTSAEWRSAIGENTAGLSRLVPLVVDRTRLPDSLPVAFRERIVDMSDISERAARQRLIPAVTGRPAGTAVPARTARGTVRRRFPGEEPVIWSRWIPPRNLRFAGRGAELSKLRDLLERAPRGGAVAVLTGMGAVGKSEIAVEYVYRYRSEYDAVWFIRGTRSAVARQDLLALGAKLEFDGDEHALQASLDAVLQRLHEDAARRRWLIVIDDARTAEAVRPILPNFTGSSGHVVITSAEGDWSAVSAEIPVEPMVEDDSHSFLQPRLADCGLTEEETALLIEYCGGLPAAMEITSAHLRTTPQLLSAYLTQLRDRPLTAFSDTPARYPNRLVQTYLVALDEVSEKSPAAGQLLRLVSFMASAPIPIRLFTGLHGLNENTVLADLAQAMAPGQDGTGQRALLEEIRRRYLAKIARYGDELTIAMHRVPQGVIAASIPEPQAELYRHTVHLLLRVRDFELTRDVQQWHMMLDTWRNLEASKAWSCRLCADDESARALILHVIRALMSWRESEHCRISAQEVIATWTPILGADHTDIRTATLDLANALRNEGKAAASLELDQALRLSLEQIPDSRPETAVRVGLNLGGDLRRLGRYPEALVIDQETLRLATADPFDSQHRLAEMARNNVAISHLLLGEPAAALASDEILLADRQRNRSETDRAIFNTLTRIALAHSELGDYRNALHKQEQTARRANKLFGPDNLTTITAQLLLGAFQRKSGDYEEARQTVQSAALHLKKLVGSEHPEVAMAQTELANCLRCAGRLEEALESGQRAFDVSQAVNGCTHPSTAICLNNLAIVHIAAGQALEAKKFLHSAADILGAVFPDEHRHRLIVRANTTTALMLQADFTTAFRLSTPLLDEAKLAFGDDHPIALACAANHVTTLDALGSTVLSAMANALSTQVIGAYTRTLGREHPETRISMERKDRVLIPVDAVLV